MVTNFLSKFSQSIEELTAKLSSSNCVNQLNIFTDSLFESQFISTAVNSYSSFKTSSSSDSSVSRFDTTSPENIFFRPGPIILDPSELASLLPSLDGQIEQKTTDAYSGLKASSFSSNLSVSRFDTASSENIFSRPGPVILDPSELASLLPSLDGQTEQQFNVLAIELPKLQASDSGNSMSLSNAQTDTNSSNNISSLVQTTTPADSNSSSYQSDKSGQATQSFEAPQNEIIQSTQSEQPTQSEPSLELDVSLPVSEVGKVEDGLFTSSSLVTFSKLNFDGKEGSSGNIQVQLNLSQAPTSNVVLMFSPANFLVVDTDNDSRNGTQKTITFTPTNWNQPRTIHFIAEKDGVAAHLTSGNLLNYSLSGGLSGSGSYNLGVIQNTYAPKPNQFNIDLDFRNDSNGFWTTARRKVAEKAASDWAALIANEWTGIQLNHSLSKIGNDGTYTNQTFETKQFVDDLLVFVNTIDSGGSAAGFGGPEYDIGGWISSPEIMPRVGQIAIDPAVGDAYLYNAVSHEIGHTLGLLGLNWTGYLQQEMSNPATATFKGAYSAIANGGKFIPLQSQDGANSVTGEYDYWHPSDSVRSIMSYGWLYKVSGPTAIDRAMLADSGYKVYGVNA